MVYGRKYGKNETVINEEGLELDIEDETYDEENLGESDGNKCEKCKKKPFEFEVSCKHEKKHYNGSLCEKCSTNQATIQFNNGEVNKKAYNAFNDHCQKEHQKTSSSSESIKILKKYEAIQEVNKDGWDKLGNFRGFSCLISEVENHIKSLGGKILAERGEKEKEEVFKISCCKCSQNVTDKKHITRFEVDKQDTLTYCETCFAKFRSDESAIIKCSECSDFGQLKPVQREGRIKTSNKFLPAKEKVEQELSNHEIICKVCLDKSIKDYEKTKKLALKDLSFHEKKECGNNSITPTIPICFSPNKGGNKHVPSNYVDSINENDLVMEEDNETEVIYQEQNLNKDKEIKT
ncbi:13642_t:CDS:2 [Funneliformis geosporum]|uniref:13642_t:CDS:1 n=1 Tax=Funneliformis geosporum TaxID=1117311 RepID=A0A9W4X5L0_9GLOM|nr:13642_t:CDS:2 [Funneliformis geosporum]